ncbi:MAG: hypothetical protein WD850_01660 [Candidatus Spechtbacterales bacterium]
MANIFSKDVFTRAPVYVRRQVNLEAITATTAPIQFVDNNVYHTSAARVGELCRVTTSLHNTESNGSLASKVDAVLPELFSSSRGLEKGGNETVEIIIATGTTEFTFGLIGLLGNDSSVLLTGTVGAAIVTTKLPAALLRQNAFKQHADLMRAVYMLLFVLLGRNLAPLKSGDEKRFIWLQKRLISTTYESTGKG